MKVEQTPVQQIIPYTNNPRINDESVSVVALSIKEFGFRVPIIIDVNNVIITGHTRWLAAKELGMDTVPTIVAKDLSETQVKAFRIMDNKSSEKSLWDIHKLIVEFDDLDALDCNFDSLGFDMIEIDSIRGVGHSEEFSNPHIYDGSNTSDSGGYDKPSYTPKSEPSMTNRHVTDKDLESAKNKLEFGQVDKLNIEVICPECLHTFEIGA